MPETKGFSEINLRYTEKFYRLFPEKIVPQVGEEILLQVGTKIFMVPWNHVKCILAKCGSDQGKALFYIEGTNRNNWSRAVLLNFLGTGLYERKGKALTNFESTLPNIGGDLARQISIGEFIGTSLIKSVRKYVLVSGIVLKIVSGWYGLEAHTTFSGKNDLVDKEVSATENCEYRAPSICVNHPFIIRVKTAKKMEGFRSRLSNSRPYPNRFVQ